MPCNEVVRSLPHISPSVQTVLCTLVEHTPMTGQQIRESTGLPRRTVYAALKVLKTLGILRERASLRDTRQTYFWVTAAPGQVAPAVLAGAAA
ncbi:MAG: MarR family winged helix-turn-helix transcriptional regulator [Candidatus Thermoplasmatota archaeon]